MKTRAPHVASMRAKIMAPCLSPSQRSPGFYVSAVQDF